MVPSEFIGTLFGPIAPRCSQTEADPGPPFRPVQRIVDAMWCFGPDEGVKMVELASASNMKRTWATWHDRDWMSNDDGGGREFLRAATHVKNVWVPYGE